MSFYLCLPLRLLSLSLPPFPFLLSYTTPHPSVLRSSPNLKPTPLPLREVDRAYLCSGKHSFAATAVLLSSFQSFLPLICCPSHLSTLSSFLLFSPISSAQMRCCVQRRVCTFLIASSCPGIRWGKWACNETESTAVQTHTLQVCRYFVCVCVCMCVCKCMCEHILASGWLRSPSFSSHYFCHCTLFSLPVSLLQPLPASSVSYHLSLFMPPTVCRSACLSLAVLSCPLPQSLLPSFPLKCVFVKF